MDTEGETGPEHSKEDLELLVLPNWALEGRPEQGRPPHTAHYTHVHTDCIVTFIFYFAKKKSCNNMFINSNISTIKEYTVLSG